MYKLNVSLSFNEISTFAVIRLDIVIKKYPYEYLIDCLYVPINRDTSVCSEVTCDDNTLNQLFRQHCAMNGVNCSITMRKCENTGTYCGTISEQL